MPIELLSGLDHLVVQDIFLTKTARLADVVLPGTATWCEAEGTVTNSERRVQRIRKALDPPGQARDDVQILLDLAITMGRPIGPTAEGDYGPTRRSEAVWNELRSLSPMHAGMTYAGWRSWAVSSGRASTRTGWSRPTCTAVCGPRIRPSEAGSPVQCRRR